MNHNTPQKEKVYSTDNLSSKNKPFFNEANNLDYYYEGPYLVFTAHYLKQGGFCCKNNCRHCPYKKLEKTSNTEV